jgi:hypothetical protein
LFFDSADTLVPQDTNGKEDVYEYEPEGVGGSSGCTGASATFSKASDGCVGLISSGASSEESAFLDASETGDDVFFITASKLVDGDVDGAYDVYDAHVCGSEGVACTTEALVPPPCTTAESCKAAATPQPLIFGAPSSATFSGAGNLPSMPAAPAVKPKSKPVKCKKGFVKKHNKCVKKKSKKTKAEKTGHKRGAK